MASNADNSDLDRVIAEFLERSRSGKEPDCQALLDAHPELAAELKSFFANHDGMKDVASDDVTVAPTPTMPPDSDPHDDATIPPNHSQPAREGRKPKIRYFGDYELLEEIARGGMGVVYKARQVNLNRVVALKMILAGQLASKQDVQRFYAEAEAAANLDHPGIVPIYEVGEYEGQHYFSMGFVQGQSLADTVKDGPLPQRHAAEYTKQIAEAVAFAHERGVIHRDLKPANVLRCHAGVFYQRWRATGFGECGHDGQSLGRAALSFPLRRHACKLAVGMSNSAWMHGLANLFDRERASVVSTAIFQSAPFHISFFTSITLSPNSTSTKFLTIREVWRGPAANAITTKARI